MELHLDVHAANGYRSPSQRARRITEAWFGANMYCPACRGERLAQNPQNTPVVDFRCSHCDEEFQVKARSLAISGRLRDAAYEPMMERVLDNRSPHFAFMHYDSSSWTVRDLLLVPGHFITPTVIEKCRPLSRKARRAGWVGCNILTDLIPSDGRIFVVRQGHCVPKVRVREQWKRFEWLSDKEPEVRGWLSDVLRCVRSLEKDFTLEQVYQFEEELAALHPRNKHVRDKIRQQLQFLRDRGIIHFVGRGRYQAI